MRHDNYDPELEPLKNLIESRFSKLEEFLTTTWYGIQFAKEEESKFIQGRIDEDIKKFPEAENEIREHYERLGTLDYSDFEVTLRTGTFLTIYSLFENYLLRICKLAEKRTKFTVKHGDMAGRGVGQLYLYLQKIIMIDLEDLKEETNEIHKYRDIRNLIVHESNIWTDRRQPLTQQKFYRLITNNPSLKLQEEGNFEIIDDTFVIHFIGLSKKHLLNILYKIAIRVD